jgi:hypothetical protein
MIERLPLHQPPGSVQRRRAVPCSRPRGAQAQQRVAGRHHGLGDVEAVVHAAAGCAGSDASRLASEPRARRPRERLASAYQVRALNVAEGSEHDRHPACLVRRRKEAPEGRPPGSSPSSAGAPGPRRSASLLQSGPTICPASSRFASTKRPLVTTRGRPQAAGRWQQLRRDPGSLWPSRGRCSEDPDATRAQGAGGLAAAPIPRRPAFQRLITESLQLAECTGGLAMGRTRRRDGRHCSSLTRLVAAAAPYCLRSAQVCATRGSSRRSPRPDIGFKRVPLAQATTAG